MTLVSLLDDRKTSWLSGICRMSLYVSLYSGRELEHELMLHDCYLCTSEGLRGLLRTLCALHR